MKFYGDCFSFGLGFVERSQTFEFVGVMRVKPQLGENKLGIIKLHDV